MKFLLWAVISIPIFANNLDSLEKNRCPHITGTWEGKCSSVDTPAEGAPINQTPTLRLVIASNDFGINHCLKMTVNEKENDGPDKFSIVVMGTFSTLTNPTKFGKIEKSSFSRWSEAGDGYETVTAIQELNTHSAVQEILQTNLSSKFTITSASTASIDTEGISFKSVLTKGGISSSSTRHSKNCALRRIQ